MLKNKPQELTVESTDLFKISLNIIEVYNIQSNLYSILLLSYLTVKEYSRHYDHLDKHAKIDLSIKYSPDLIQGLYQSKIIVTDDYKKYTLRLRDEDFRDLFEQFYIIFTYKNDHQLAKSKYRWFNRWFI